MSVFSPFSTWDGWDTQSSRSDPVGSGGRKTAAWVSDPIAENGLHAYTAYAKDPSCNVTARTVFFETSGIPDSPALSGDTAPNTADPTPALAAAAGMSALLAFIPFRRAKSRTGSR